MECKLAVSMMHDYLDDDLPELQQRELKEHLLSCPIAVRSSKNWNRPIC